MYLQTKPHPWSCLATSFAMALDIPTWHFHELAGHDGSQIIFPELPEPLCRRGFHVNEAVLVALVHGFATTPYELMPAIAPTRGQSQPVPVLMGRLPTEAKNWSIFQELIRCNTGVIECVTGFGNGHAVALDSDVIYDPDGREFDYSREKCEARGLYTKRLWIVEKTR